MPYLAKRGSVYYFRLIVPDDLRVVLSKREIMLSLRTKDREQAKQLIPVEIIKSDALFAAARKQLRPEAVNRRANGTPYRRAKGTPCQDGGTLM